MDLINRIRTRKLYKFVKELTYYVKDKDYEKIVKIFDKSFQKAKIAEEIAKLAQIEISNICIVINDVGFGLKEANPLRRIGFFRKE